MGMRDVQTMRGVWGVAWEAADANGRSTAVRAGACVSELQLGSSRLLLLSAGGAAAAGDAVAVRRMQEVRELRLRDGNGSEDERSGRCGCLGIQL